MGSVRRVRGPLVSGTGSTLVLALVTFDHLRSLVTAGGQGEAGVLTDVVTMGEVGGVICPVITSCPWLSTHGNY